MLNLYLAPRSGKAPRPDDAMVDAAVAFLIAEGFIRPGDQPDRFPPGRAAAALFNDDNMDLLPAELTFDELRVETAARPVFLPQNAPVDTFVDAGCSVCGDDIDLDGLQDALDRVGIFPIDRVTYQCPSCQTDLSLRQIEFARPTAVARFWFFIEGAATSRLRSSVVDRLGRILGAPLIVVAEVPEDSAEDWIPARRARRK